MSKKKVLGCSFRVILIKNYIISHNTVLSVDPSLYMALPFITLSTLFSNSDESMHSRDAWPGLRDMSNAT